MGTPYAWVFDMNTGALFTGPFQSSIKARYVDGNGKKKGALVSENITLMVAEPGTLVLLGVGLAGLFFVGRRRQA